MVRIALLMVLLLPNLCFAEIDVYQFVNELQEQRYREFIKELRCPTCKNQNLADSDAPVAADLRRELRRLLEEKKSDQEVIDFMTKRYGDFILYDPRLKLNTLLLWFGPVLMILAGLAILVRPLLRREEESDSTLSIKERDRLDKFMSQKLMAEQERGQQ